MMSGLQQQRPWGVSSMIRSLPQAQHGSGAEPTGVEVLERAPVKTSATPQQIQAAKPR